MPRSGGGVYSLPAGLPVNGETSDATDDIRTPFQDLEADMNTPRPVVAGGTGAASAADARTNLGLAIGTNVQAYDAGLTSIAGLTTAADRMIYTTASDVYAVATLTAAGRAILDDADAAAQRTTLGLGTAATVDVIDEDSFATNSATRPPSQQSTKAYVDTAIAGVGSGEVTWLTEQATTSGTAFDFTGIPATATEIFVWFDSTSLSGTDSIIIQLGTSGGPVTTGYTSQSFGGSGVASTAGFVVAIISAGNDVMGIMNIMNPSSNNWIGAGTFNRTNTQATVTSSGKVNLGGTLTQVRITRTGSNTFDAGAVNVGYR